jgi:hypothetical protein
MGIRRRAHQFNFEEVCPRQAANMKSTALNQIKEIKALGGDVVRLVLKFYYHMNNLEHSVPQ